MSNPTFEQLPAMVAHIMDEVGELKDLINNTFGKIQTGTADDIWMDLNELCEYLPGKPTKPTVYTWVCNRQIPFYKKTKRLYFLKSEIDRWMENSGHSTSQSLKEEALEAHGYRKGGLK
ncbi:MAG: helix-turn-helix domain-containing protein [Candidatus Cryptobacteroides sp.]